MLLAFATGGRSDTKLVVKEYDWNKLCGLAAKPRVGDKDGSYLIRGGKLKVPKRADENLLEGELIVLDGDSQFDPETGEVIEGAPPLPDVAKALDTLGITFCAHTSHSARPEDGFWKYRILIPAKLSNAQQLADCVDFILEQLRGFGIYLSDVPEAKRWSQPWYLPRVRDEAALANFVSMRADCLPFDVRMAQEWADARRQAEAVRAQEAAQQAPQAQQPARQFDGENKIEAFNSAQSREDVRSILERAGYIFGYYDRGADVLRFMRPGSTTKTAGDAKKMTPSDLREILEARKMSQQALARLLGVNPRTVRRWVELNRERLPELAIMRLRLAKLNKPQPEKPKTRRVLAPGEFPGPGS